MRNLGPSLRICFLLTFFFFLVSCADRRVGGLTEEEKGEAANLTTNVYALHDSSSSQYRDDCLSCHSDVLTEESLDPSIPSAHSAMLPETPGATTQAKCVYCHTNTDLLQYSTGNIRRQVAVETCNLCHGTAGPAANQYYENPGYASE